MPGEVGGRTDPARRSVATRRLPPDEELALSGPGRVKCSWRVRETTVGGCRRQLDTPAQLAAAAIGR